MWFDIYGGIIYTRKIGKDYSIKAPLHLLSLSEIQFTGTSLLTAFPLVHRQLLSLILCGLTNGHDPDVFTWEEGWGEDIVSVSRSLLSWDSEQKMTVLFTVENQTENRQRELDQEGWNRHQQKTPFFPVPVCVSSHSSFFELVSWSSYACRDLRGCLGCR